MLATGVDFVDLAALSTRGIALRSLPGYSSTSVAEHTIGLLLTLSRRLHLSRDRTLGRVSPTTSLQGVELRGKTLGIVGMGGIGRRVATLAEAFGMRLVGTDPRGPSPVGVTTCALDEVLTTADAVTLHASTRWRAGPLLAEAQLRPMRPHAHLVNASRASLVDERAVVAAIASGRLAGHAVDDRLDDSLRRQAVDLLREGRIVRRCCYGG